jgi:FkbM family methyltransferase
MDIDFLLEINQLCKRHADKATKALPSKKAIWIFGAGQFGRDLCSAMQRNKFTVAGFVETNPQTANVMGLPLVNWLQWSEAYCDYPLCIGIFNRGMPLNELETIARQAGARDIFFPWDFYPRFKEDLGWRFWLSEPKFILSHTEEITKALQCLSDETSKRCLLDIVTFRLGLNTTYGSFQHQDRQYFNKITLDAFAGKPIRFLDGGAYNGDTYLELCSLTEVNAAYLFEPDQENFLHLVKNVRNACHPTHCLPLGLSDCYQILSFNAGNGESGSITQKGNTQIAVTALDDVLTGSLVDFIKLDVEGAELQALRGGQHLIKRSRPVIAMSLYHLPQDLWELPLTLSSMCPDYRFYIRQHYSNSFDSVLYAVPVSR